MEININEPINNDELLYKIDLLKENPDEKNYEVFIEQLLIYKMLCPIKLQSKSNLGLDENITKESTNVNMYNIKNEKEESFLMGFTDWTELYKWNKCEKHPQALLLSCMDYIKIITQNSYKEGFVINPYGKEVLIRKKDFNYILSRSSIIKKDSPIMVGIPKEYPSDMVSELKMYFTTIKIVKAAYLLWMVKGEETSYLLVIDCCGNPEEEFPKIADICRPFLKGKLLDMISFNTSFAKNVVKNQKPFYQM